MSAKKKKNPVWFSKQLIHKQGWEKKTTRGKTREITQTEKDQIKDLD